VTDQPIRWGRILTIASAGVVSHTFGRTSLAVLIPAMEDDLGLSGTVTGALGSVNLGSYLVGVLTVTLLAGRVEPFTLLRSGIAVVAAGLFVLGTAGSTAQVIVGTGLAGSGGAGIWLTTPILATEGVPANRRGAVMATLTATMGAVFVFVPIAATAVREVADDGGVWRQLWVIEGVASLLLLALLWWRVTPESTEPIEGAFAFRALTRLRGWRPAVGMYMTFAFVAASFSLFAARAFEHDHGFSRNHATLLLSVLGLGSLVGAMAFGRLSDRYGRPRVMTLAMAITSGTGLLMLVGSEPWAAIAMFVYGATSFAYPVLTATFVRDQVEQREFTGVFGAMTIFYGPASIAGPAVSGALADRTGDHTATYLLLAAAAAVAALFASRLPRVDHAAGGPSTDR